MLEAFSGWFNLDCCFVVLPSDEEPEDSIRSEYFADEEYQLMQQDVDLRTLEVFKQNFQGEQLLMANDAAHDRRLEPFRKDALPNYHFFSLFFVPITYEQKLLGLLGGYKCESQANWNRDNEAFLKSVADQVATGVTNARLYARVQRQATTDGLTSLYNHRTGQEKLAEQLRLAERYQRNLAVVMIDVDHFKSINDNYGHPAGDSVLKAVAKLVKSDCRDVDLPVRYGGEEFLLVLPEVNQEGAAVVAERIRKSLSQEIIRHEDIQISVTASFGIAAFPEDAHNQQQLLDLADKALYLSKRLGRNQVHTAGDLMFEEISPTKLPEPSRAEQRQDGEDQEDLEGSDTDTPEEKSVSSAPSAVPAVQQFNLPSNTYADFVPTAVSAAAEQKEELVPEVVEMVNALATALYSKSDYNKQHHLETARLSELLAKVMGLSQQQVEQIRVAGLLHDVGTLSIPADLLNKPGKYNADEREIINQHAVLGAQLLRPIRALRDICEILENHHERWDGLGYPRGLKGEEIPLPARIVSIVDSYHAMISDRPYRDAMTREEAIQTLKEGAGIQWDPFLVDIFVAVLASLNDPRSAPLAAPTPATARIEASKAEPAKPEAPPPSPVTSVAAAPALTEPPVMNARQRLLQSSQQQALASQPATQAPLDAPLAAPAPSPAPAATPLNPVASVADNIDADEFDEFDDEELDNEAEDLTYPEAVSERSDKVSAPSALEQLRRVPPEQQAAIFQQASQRAAGEIPAHAQQGLAPQRTELSSHVPTPQQAAIQAAMQSVQPATLPVVQQASAQFIQPQPSQPPLQPGAPQSVSQPFPQQAPPQNTSQPVPQQAPPQNISQPLPQQAPPQNISQPLPQQAPPQNISQPLPQQPRPTAQQIAQQAHIPYSPQDPRQQLASQQPPQAPQYPQQTPQQSPPQNPQPAPQAMPQQAAPQQAAPQTPPPQNLFPHLQQLQNSNQQPTQPQQQSPAAPHQQYAPQNPQYPSPPQPLTPTNPLVPQERTNQPPANPPEHEQPRPANPDQFYEEP
ncbi:MAG: diguanylate cyclase [Candidatus Melainabacteria bacterium]|nr:diguanylate cyclase [Candidatus Melainabacteria bacterium]